MQLDVWGYLMIMLVAGAILFRRVKLSGRFRKVSPWLMWLRLLSIGFLGAASLIIGYFHPLQWIGDAIALAAGYMLAIRAIADMEFEVREKGLFYRIPQKIQILILGMVVTRISYRLLTNPYQLSAQDALTAAIFCFIAAFYVVLNVFLLRSRKGLSYEYPESR